MGIKITVDYDIGKEVKHLNMIQRETMKEVAIALSELGEDILNESNDMCPYKTGELRNSGKAFLKRGTRQEKVAWVEGANSGGGGTVKTGGTAGLSAAHNWELDVSYEKFADDGFDVAEFTHEDLNPAGGASPAARQPGTGPKYLEKALDKTYSKFERELEARINKRISKLGNI